MVGEESPIMWGKVQNLSHLFKLTFVNGIQTLTFGLNPCAVTTSMYGQGIRPPGAYICISSYLILSYHSSNNQISFTSAPSEFPVTIQIDCSKIICLCHQNHCINLWNTAQLQKVLRKVIQPMMSNKGCFLSAPIVYIVVFCQWICFWQYSKHDSLTKIASYCLSPWTKLQN